MSRLLLRPPWSWCLAPCAASLLTSSAQAQATWRERWCPTPAHAIARASVTEPLARQANNGMILDQTVWNHYFKEGDAELHQSGQYFLDRLARRSSGCILLVHVQTSRD